MELAGAWLFVAVCMAVIEALSTSLITLWFVIGALVAALAAYLGLGFGVQLAVFLVVSLVCLAAIRPVALRSRDSARRSEPTLVGKPAVVTEEIPGGGLGGRVETPDHMSWLALSSDGSPFPAGEKVMVVAQESVKLIVAPLPSAPQGAPPADQAAQASAESAPNPAE